jgi:hypothetical protein
MSGKTISALNNTISGLTTSNLSNSAGITNSQLANSSLTITAGTGLSGGGTISLGGIATLSANLTTSGTTGSTASNSGLEVSAAGLTLLKGCADNQILKYTDGGGWACSADSTGGSPSFDLLTSGTNTIASMTIGTGGSLTFTGTGTINASTLNGNTFANPGAIGSGTAGTGTFSGLTVSSGALSLTST